MFFSKIRGHFGWNNNLNVLEFKYASRALSVKNNIDAPGTANCTDVGEDSVQSLSSSSCSLSPSEIIH